MWEYRFVSSDKATKKAFKGHSISNIRLSLGAQGMKKPVKHSPAFSLKAATPGLGDSDTRGPLGFSKAAAAPFPPAIPEMRHRRCCSV